MIAEELIGVEYRLANTGYSLSGKRVLVVGLGASGLSAASYLVNLGAVVTVTDKRAEAEITGIDSIKEAGVVMELGGHNIDSFRTADLIVLSPGVAPSIEPVRAAKGEGVEIVSDIELFSRLSNAPVIAITGTNGKTTTTTLFGEVLKEAGSEVFVGGNIGRPALDYFTQYRDGKEADYAVLEISSYHLEQVSSFRPKVAVLLNITEDHLDRYDGFTDYAQTKFRVFAKQNSDDFAVVNLADAVIVKHLKTAGIKARIIGFSSEGLLEDGFYLAQKGGEEVIVRASAGDKKEYSLSGVNIIGRHNVENIMAVLAMAEALDIDGELVMCVARGFKGLRHRAEFVRELGGVSYMNDSKSTNAGSLFKALVGLATPVVLIAGGRDKHGNYDFLKELVGARVSVMIVIGEASGRLQEAFAEVTQVVVAGNLDEAVGIARKVATQGATVLFSPACSSFDMFRNYEERGERFRALVEALC